MKLRKTSYNKHHTLLTLMMNIPFIGIIVRVLFKRNYPNLKKELFGIEFPNPLGLGGGVDINGEFYNKLANAGFGFVEIGSITPVEQGGSLPNKGLKYAIQRLKKDRPKAIIGANITKNASTGIENAPKDFEKCFALLYDFVDMFIVNVSSPTFENSDTMQEYDQLSDIADRLISMRMYFDVYRPIFIKISPDLSYSQVDDILSYCMRSGIDGVVACNLSKNKEEDLFSKNLAMVKYIHEKTNGRLPIIGSGGIRTPQMAKEMLDAGASLVEICTAFITEGPSLVRKTLKYLDKQS